MMVKIIIGFLGSGERGADPPPIEGMATSYIHKEYQVGSYSNKVRILTEKRAILLIW